MRKALILLFIVLLVTVPGCKLSGTHSELSDEQLSKLELIKEIKAFEATLGFSETENFKAYSEETEAYDYTFFTSKTILPYSLDDPLLQHSRGKPESIGINPGEYDIFFYSIEALAGIKTPVTRSLLQTTLPRFIYIIFHEDWHEQIDSTLGIEEPSAEVIGYPAAMFFAEEKFGTDSSVYKALEKEFNNKLKEGEIYRQYYEELNHLYSLFHSARIAESETLSRKADLLESMSNDIKSLWGGRPKQLNNASISFRMTYYRYFTLMHQVYSMANFDLTKTMAIFRSAPAQGAKFDSVEELKNIESAVTDYLHELSQK